MVCPPPSAETKEVVVAFTLTFGIVDTASSYYIQIRVSCRSRFYRVGWNWVVASSRGAVGWLCGLCEGGEATICSQEQHRWYYQLCFQCMANELAVFNAILYSSFPEHLESNRTQTILSPAFFDCAFLLYIFFWSTIQDINRTHTGCQFCSHRIPMSYAQYDFFVLCTTCSVVAINVTTNSATNDSKCQ